MPHPDLLHIAIIPDGNRRWAKKRSLKPWDGHKVAVENFRKLTQWCRDDPRVGTFTIWCFSTENWKRDAREISMLMKMLEDYLKDERSTFLQNHTRFIHSGRKDRIPPSLAKIIEEVENETATQTENVLHLAVDYGGKDEIVRAMNRMEDATDATEDSLHAHLDHPELSDIDLIIRTSGEQRTSNFFLWQSAYAEWTFIDKLFPDFTTEDLSSEVGKYSDRTRRFGA